MKETKTYRGFQLIKHADYLDENKIRLVQQSSAIRYENGYDKPGTSCLWVGENLHLDREQVSQLIGYLNHWLETGKLYEED